MFRDELEHRKWPDSLGALQLWVPALADSQGWTGVNRVGWGQRGQPVFQHDSGTCATHCWPSAFWPSLLPPCESPVRRAVLCGISPMRNLPEVIQLVTLWSGDLSV